MTEIESLKKYYEYLVGAAPNIHFSFGFNTLAFKVNPLAADYKNRGMIEEFEKCQCEFIAFMSYEQEIGGEEVTQLPATTRQYYETRLNAVEHPLLKIVYSHILWLLEPNIIKWKFEEINNLFLLQNLYQINATKTQSDEQELWNYDHRTVVKKLIIISRQYAHRHEEALNIFQMIIRPKTLISSQISNELDLIQFMLSQFRIFTLDKFEGIAQIIWHLSQCAEWDNKIDLLKMGAKVDSKLHTVSFAWDLEIAREYEKMMEHAAAEKAPITSHYCSSAIEHYKSLKQNQKVSELGKKLIEYKRYLQFVKIPIKGIDLSKQEAMHNQILTATDAILDQPTYKILEILCTDKGTIIPSEEEITPLVEDYIKKSGLLHVLPIQHFDGQGNIREHVITEEQHHKNALATIYKIYLGQVCLPILTGVIRHASDIAKLDGNTVIQFLEHTFYGGIVIYHSFPVGEIKEFSLLNWIKPGILDLFSQFKSSNPDWTLCLDSLTLKIEGILRLLCREWGGVTIKPKRLAIGNMVEEEKNINDLLVDESITKTLTWTDLHYLRFLLIDENGFNLRHRLSHCLLYPPDYGEHFAGMVLVAIMRLAKYSLIKDNDKLKSP